ncbi:MAG: DNA-binding response regulator [Actinobacteria bacterium]|nr:DNA-binding response regulator [Actinomycetota bacterium]
MGETSPTLRVMTTDTALVIERNPIDRKFMQNALQSWGLDVRAESDLGRIRDEVSLNDFKLVLFHLAGDVMKTLDLLGWLRLQTKAALVPLIDNDGTFTEEMCVRAGADEIITKPIVQKLFLQRINYQLDKNGNSSKPEDDVYEIDDLSLEVPLCEFRVKGKVIPLTKTEFLLTQAFMAEPERVISRPELLSVIKVKDGIGSSHLIDTHLSRLRIKIKESCGRDYIYSIRGLGVKFLTPEYLNKESAQVS